MTYGQHDDLSKVAGFLHRYKSIEIKQPTSGGKNLRNRPVPLRIFFAERNTFGRKVLDVSFNGTMVNRYIKGNFNVYLS